MDKNLNRETVIRVGVTFALVLAFFLAVLTVKAIKEYQYVGYDPANRNTITVRGEGEEFSVPDTAVFSFTVTEEAKTMAEAQQKATSKMEAVVAVLAAEGIEEKDRKTVGYSSYPKYEYPSNRPVVCNEYGCPPSPSGNPTIVGYEISHTVEVKVRESQKAGDVMGKVGAQQVSNMSSLEFRVDDDSEVLAKARQAAIEDAREKAEVLADALGVRLVRVVSFNDSGYPGPIYYGREAAMAMDAAKGGASAPVPVQPGENKYVSNVEVVYEIR